MALPLGAIGSLTPTFVSARHVRLAVKLPYAFALYDWFPFSLREPLHASVTFWEATDPVKLPTRHCSHTGSRHRLESKLSQSGISRTTPPNLATQLHSLPPILHKLSTNSMSSYSKASRGLFVLLRVRSIFTPNSVSPGPSLRQCPIRYAFRAGRNLPDKEFRYLRTVIVTAAVHRGFSSKLSPLPLTFRHWAGVSLYTSSFDFAQTCVFGKQSTGPFLCGLLRLLCVRTIILPRRSFSRSYGSILPNSLTKVIPIPLVFSTHLPVSVCGTVTQDSLEAFLDGMGSITTAIIARHHSSALSVF